MDPWTETSSKRSLIFSAPTAGTPASQAVLINGKWHILLWGKNQALGLWPLEMDPQEFESGKAALAEIQLKMLDLAHQQIQDLKDYGQQLRKQMAEDEIGAL